MDADRAYWHALYERVCLEGVSLAGHYNRNYRTGSRAGEVVVRVPIAEAPMMDITGLAEPDAMRAAAHAQMPVPQVVYVSADPEFQVHSFIPGRTLERVRAQAELDAMQVGQLCRLLVWAWRAPTSGLTPTQTGWPTDVHSFWEMLLTHARRLHAREQDRHGEVLAALGVPADPFGVFEQVGRGLTERKFVLGHCDLHPGNVLVDAQGRFWALDWQLALLCDPAFDTTCHLMRARYTPQQEAWFWHAFAQLDVRGSDPRFRADVQRHQHLEAAKSVMVDTERVFDRLAAAGTVNEREFAVRSLWRSLQWTAQVWGHPAWTQGQLVALLEQFITRR